MQLEVTLAAKIRIGKYIFFNVQVIQSQSNPSGEDRVYSYKGLVI